MISSDINKIIFKLILVVISQGLLLLDLLQNKKERSRKKIVFVWKFQKKILYLFDPEISFEGCVA